MAWRCTCGWHTHVQMESDTNAPVDKRKRPSIHSSIHRTIVLVPYNDPLSVHVCMYASCTYACTYLHLASWNGVSPAASQSASRTQKTKRSICCLGWLHTVVEKSRLHQQQRYLRTYGAKRSVDVEIQTPAQAASTLGLAASIISIIVVHGAVVNAKKTYIPAGRCGVCVSPPAGLPVCLPVVSRAQCTLTLFRPKEACIVLYCVQVCRCVRLPAQHEVDAIVEQQPTT